MCSSFAWLFAGLDDVLGRVERMEQGLPGIVPHAPQTSDTSGGETDVSEPRRRVRSKRTFKMKKVWAADELGRFFVTGPTDASGKPSHFYCRLCRKDVSVLTHGMHEILRHYQGTKHFPRDQRLRLETPGWRVLDFEGNVMRDEEVARQRDRILRGPLVVRDREYPFSEDLVVDSSGSVDASLPVLAKVSSLVEALRLGGSYELVHRLWSQFTLIAGQVNVDVTWSRDEVLVSSLLSLPMHSSQVLIVVLLLVDHPQRNVPTNFEEGIHVGKVTWVLRGRVRGKRRAHLGVPSLLGRQSVSSGVCGSTRSVQWKRE